MRSLLVALFFGLLTAPESQAAEPQATKSSTTESHAAANSPLHGSRPNIVLIITDDQGYAPVGAHGHPWIKTPHLDELFARSTRFDRFLVSPTCAPTRSALMTGRHPMRNGITHTILERERLALDAVTLPQMLQASGYQTAIFGKWHLGDEDAYQPQARGFNESFIHGGGGIGQQYNCSCADAPNNKYFDPFIRHNGKFVKTEGFCTDVFFSAALRWIDQQSQSEAPFFAHIATNAPHSPYIAPPEKTKRFTEAGFTKDEAGFYGMIENIDDNVGRLLAAMESMKLTDNTLIIFMSDNGMAGMPGPKNRPLGTDADGKPMLRFNAGMKGFKGSVDEGGVRVPLFMRWDKHLPADRSINAVTAHIDLLPTLAELAGADMPTKQVEGRSLLPLLESDPESDPSDQPATKGESTLWPDRFLFDHTGRWPTGAEPNDYQWQNFCVRSARFRLVGRNELFDMQLDPGQTKNCIEEHRELADEMLAAYDQWWRETRPMMVNETAPMSPTKPFHEAFRAQEKSEGIPSWPAK